MDEHREQPRWTRTSTIEVDGRLVTIETSNVPPPGTPRRLYWFSARPTSEVDAVAITEHINELRALANRVDADRGDGQSF